MTFADLAGTTWKFREEITLPVYSTGVNYVLGSNSEAPLFSCRGINYQLLYIGVENNGLKFGTQTNTSEGLTTVYCGSWMDNRYRTITFKETLSNYTFNGTEASFINWLTSNAIRQGQKIYKVYHDQIRSLADAIRTKSSNTGQYLFPSGFVSAVNNITTKPSETSVSVSGPASDTTLAPGGMVSLGSIPVDRLLKGIKITGKSSEYVFIRMTQDYGSTPVPASVYYINTGSSSQTVQQNSQGLSYKYFNS